MQRKSVNSKSVVLINCRKIYYQQKNSFISLGQNLVFCLGPGRAQAKIWISLSGRAGLGTFLPLLRTGPTPGLKKPARADIYVTPHFFECKNMVMRMTTVKQNELQNLLIRKEIISSNCRVIAFFLPHGVFYRHQTHKRILSSNSRNFMLRLFLHFALYNFSLKLARYYYRH